MSAIVEELTIAIVPERVFNALTQQDEITGWWAYQAWVKPEVGFVGEFRFRQGAFTMRLEVAELEQNKKVRWIPRQAPPEWNGTSITWQLASIHNGTSVVFTHDGFTQVDEGYERVRGAWVYFLTSLKSYLEIGKGTPGTPPGFK